MAQHELEHPLQHQLFQRRRLKSAAERACGYVQDGTEAWQAHSSAPDAPYLVRPGWAALRTAAATCKSTDVGGDSQ